jgi:hypothetical protein
MSIDLNQLGFTEEPTVWDLKVVDLEMEKEAWVQVERERERERERSLGFEHK